MPVKMEMMRGEETEWSASTATLPLEQASPRSLEDEEEEELEELTEEAEAWGGGRRQKKGLRALLLEMDVADGASPSATSSRQGSVLKAHGGEDSGGEEGEGEEDGRVARMELRQAEERVRALEARLLDAEETIYHLKAEKMEAWRWVEQLSRAKEEQADASESETAVRRLRTQVYELEGQLQNAQTQHAVDQEQRMAVIREQEQELLELRERLEQVQAQADEWELKYEELRQTTEEETAYRALQHDQDEALPDRGGGERGAGEGGGDQWQEELVRHPTPPFDLDSPEVQYWLCAWTNNPKKRQYLRTWLLHVALPHQRDLPLDFPMGIELPRLAPEIRDGFLTLVLPLLRKQPWREIVVHRKQYNDQYHTDIRVRVVSRRP